MDQWNARRRTASRLACDDRGFSLTELMVVMVILVSVLGIVTQIFVQSNRVFDTQRQFLDARNNAAATLDMLTRLLREAQAITPDPDGDLILNSVRVISDWNPHDGDTNDAYENVLFTVNGGTLFKREPSDAAPVAFADRIQSITFTYRDPAGVALATPWTMPQAKLGYVTITLQTTTTNGLPGTTISSSASVRRTE